MENNNPSKCVFVAYCDFIAHQISSHLKDVVEMSAAEPFSILHGGKVGKTNYDIHPKTGHLVSTKKTIEVTDANGTEYIVTIEEK